MAQSDRPRANPDLVWSDYQSSLIIVTGIIFASIVALFLESLFRDDGTQEAFRSARSQSALMIHLRDDEIRRALEVQERSGGAGDASPHALSGLWSTYPIPGRDGEATGFAKDALAALAGGQATEFSEITEEPGGQRLHYAVPLRMEGSCVACHNALTDSPKRDWQAGDVAGIQVIELPVPHRASMRAQDLALLLLIAASGLASIVSLLIQSHRAKLAGEDLVRKNQELEILKDRADEASRTKTQFLSNMSHEIRTPLNGIIGTLQIIDPVSLTRENRDSFDIIRRSSLSLLDIVNGILDISKIEADEATISRRQFELRPFISDVLTQHGVQATEKKIEFLVRFDPTIPKKVFTDPGKIEQVLNNLLSNAIKFTDTGSVMLSVNRLSLAEPSGNPEYPDALEFSVSDTGIGIADADQLRLFQPFKQIDGSLTRRYTGTGLGLSIVRKLATMLGGGVNLQSKPGSGSVFTVWIPAAVPAAADPTEVDTGTGNDPDVVLFGGLYATIFRACQVLTQLGARVKVIYTPEEAEGFAASPPASLRAAVVDRRFGGNALRLLELASRHRQGGWQVPTVIIEDAKPATPETSDYVVGEIVGLFSRSSLLEVLKRAGVLDSIGKLRKQSQAPQLLSAAAHLSHLKVLVVDDNSINRRVVERLLRNIGITDVVLAADASEAIDRIAAAPADLVFMDIQMPDIDGYSATKLLRQRGYHDLKIVACSAHAFESDVMRSAAEGLDGHISKPIVTSELEDLLARLFPADTKVEPAAH